MPSLMRMTLFLCASATAFAMNKDFAGTWEGTFRDTVFCVLTLDAADQITGTLQLGNLSVDDEGDLKETQAGGESVPIINVKVEDDQLSFDCKVDEETVSFKLKLLSKDKAELQIAG